MNRFHTLTIAVLSLMLLLSCHDDSNVVLFPSPDPIPLTVDRGETIMVDLGGLVVDEQNNPLPGVLVRVGSQSVLTNSDGYYLMRNVAMYDKKTAVIFELGGYFTVTESVQAYAGETNYVLAKMMAKVIAGKFDNGGGGSITDAGGNVTVSLPANAIDGYTGNVNVYIGFMNPEDDDFLEVAPGNFEGWIEDGGYITTLASFGMAYIELLDDGGNELQLADDVYAELNFNIPASLQGNAPDEIPLWYLDEEEGIWVRDGSAIKEGSSYFGKVSHFTPWNCDVPGAEPLDVDVCFKDHQGNDINGPFDVVVSFELGGFNFQQSYRTDAGGNASIQVPTDYQNANLIFTVYTFDFNNTDDCELGEFSINNLNFDGVNCYSLDIADFGIISLQGMILDCNDDPVSSGRVRLSVGNFLHESLIIDGNYLIRSPTCAVLTEMENAEIEVIDFGSGLLIDNVDLTQLTTYDTTVCGAGDRVWPGDLYSSDLQEFYDGLYTIVEGNLSLFSPGPSSLQPLENLVEVQGGVSIIWLNLSNLEGLHNLEKIGLYLSINSNQRPLDISQLNGVEIGTSSSNENKYVNIVDIGNLVSFENCRLRGTVDDMDLVALDVTNLDGLENLVVTNSIRVSHNPELADISGLGMFNSNSKVNEVLISDIGVSSQLYFPSSHFGSLTITSSSYPKVLFEGFPDNINNLDDYKIDIELLNDLTEIQFQAQSHLNRLNIRRCAQLTDLSSTSNLVEVRDLVLSDTGIQDLNGLENLTIGLTNMTLSITNNENLADYCALNSAYLNSITYSSSGNAFNPTLQDLLNGDCN